MGLTLTKIAETNTTITLGWTPVPGATGYRFTAERQAKPSHTWNPQASSVKFSKGSAWYKVEALGVTEYDTYPDAPDPDPDPGTDWFPAAWLTGPASDTVMRALIPPRKGAYVGIWDSGASGTDRIKLREQQTGRKFDYGAASYGTSAPANSDNKLSLIKNEGRIPVCSMHSGHTVAEINSGAEDNWHRSSAQAVKALGVPVLVRLFHEFNGEWMRYYTPGDTAASAQPFITAWKRVVGIWKAEAPNAAYMWHYAQSNGLNAYYRYPGDEWVDFTANSDYTYADVQWVGFYQSYARLWQDLAWAREYKVSMPSRYNDLQYKPLVDVFAKPHLLGELGHFEDPRKSQWIQDLKANLLGTFDPPKENGPFGNVVGLLYSDYGKEADPNGSNWTIDLPPSGLDGFRIMVNDPFFNTQDL